MFFRSKWWTAEEGEKGKVIKEHACTYVRPKRDGEIKGKLNLKFAKRQRVKAMKAAQGAL